MLRCPTAAAPVSRGTHLARLASGWTDCARCPHAADLAGAAPALRRRLERAAHRDRPDPFGGVAGGDFTPAHAANLAARFAATLPRRSAVVLARDERATHLPFLAPVAAALRNAGCDVLHVGAALEPEVRFAVRSAGAAGGLWIAAPDRPDGHGGVIPIGSGGRPLTLEATATLLNTPPRTDRIVGQDRVCEAAEEYETTLWPAFRTLSAVRITLASPSAAVRARFERLFASLPDDLCSVPVRRDASNEAVWETMAESRGDICLHVDASCSACTAFRSDGEPISWAETVRTLATDAVQRSPKRPDAPTVAVVSDLADGVRLKIAAAGGRLREVEDDPAAPCAALWDAVESGCVFAAGTNGRAIFRTPHGPSADAALTLAALLRTATTG